MNLLISACLIGVCCRYDGRCVPKVDFDALNQHFTLIPVCPEVMGGLPTPRVPSERRGDSVFMRNGEDVTQNYRKGAETVLHIAKTAGCKMALLKERSPSCGYGMIYDGTFSGTLVHGYGICAELLMQNGIRIYGESETECLLADF